MTENKNLEKLRNDLKRAEKEKLQAEHQLQRKKTSFHIGRALAGRSVAIDLLSAVLFLKSIFRCLKIYRKENSARH